jgi:hypothetical protein
MSEQGSPDSVKITADQQAHPAIRTIARACIALARWQGDSQPAKAAAPAGAVDGPPISADSGTEEVGDD